MSKVSKRSNKRTSEIMGEEVKDESMSPSTIIFNEEIAPGKFPTYTGWKEHRVREYEVHGERKYPTKRGACLTPVRLKILMGKFEEIDEELKQADAKVPCKVQQTQYKTHLGGGIYAAIDYKFNGVNIRRYWVSE